MSFKPNGYENVTEEYFVDSKDAYNACLAYEESLKNG